jgi:hypothetical protein
VPRFSIVIPTCARADTLEHALKTVLAQTSGDLEVILQNNGADAATRQLVKRLGDERVKEFATDDVVPMVDNWELALAQCSGELITVLGDDDGLLPDACEAAGYAVDLTGAEIVSWEPFLYLWPSFWDPRRRNRLHARVTFDFVVRLEQSREWLERFYAFETDYAKLPMLYNSFVSRSVIERVRDRYGKYFFGSLPDVTSGIIDTVETEVFAKTSRPLSVAGISGHSFGHKLSREDMPMSEAELERHFPELAQRIDPRSGSDLLWLVAIEMGVLYDEVIRERCPVDFRRRRLAHAMAASINESPARYEETKELIRGLMEEYEIPEAELEVPAPESLPPVPPDGAHLIGPSDVFFVLDGNRFGLDTITDAVGLSAQLVLAAGAIVEEEPPPQRGLLSGLAARTRRA